MRIVDFSLSHFLKMKGQIIRIDSIWEPNPNRIKIEKLREKKKKEKNKLNDFNKIKWMAHGNQS